MTLVELLIVIAIISLLVQMLIPAVQAAREAARRVNCLNNLRQLGAAALAHEAALESFPTGGWNWRWVGEPGRGSGADQPGGWIYNLLPYTENAAIHDLAAQATGEERLRRAAQMQALPASGFNCPSRRSAGPYVRDWQWSGDFRTRNADFTNRQVKSDYAANGGDLYVNLGLGPGSFEEVDEGTYQWPEHLRRATGICYARSRVRTRDIRDGLSYTYLFGEKYLNSSRYLNGRDVGDDASMYQGDDMDITRWTSPTITDHFYKLVDYPNQPRRDSADWNSGYSFGSAHTAGWNVVHCDGSAGLVSYDRDPAIHQRYGNRRDGRGHSSTE